MRSLLLNMAENIQVRSSATTLSVSNDDRCITASLRAAVVCTALFVRILVGYQPHSGQNNYHGSQTAYGGDYEAQRHWMETTLHLPIGDWYYHDLQYWYVVDSVWCDFVFDDVMDCRNCVITHGTTLK